MEMKFKVGDRVKFTKRALRELGMTSKYTNKLLEVIKTEPTYEIARIRVIDGTRLEWTDGRDWDGDIHQSWLEPAPALIDPSKKYQSRNQAWEVIEFITTKAPGDKPVVVAVRNLAGKIEIWSTYPDGRSHVSENFDLVEVLPKELEGWVNVYDRGHYKLALGIPGVAYPGTTIYATRELADQSSENPRRLGKRIACLHLKFREGEGV